MKSSAEIIEELGRQIAHMRWRPGMHFGDPNEPGAAHVTDRGFWELFRLWAWIQDRSDEFLPAQIETSREFGLVTNLPPHVSRKLIAPQESDAEICQFVIRYWERVAERLKLDISAG
jgi:hypothetical protein